MIENNEFDEKDIRLTIIKRFWVSEKRRKQ